MNRETCETRNERLCRELRDLKRRCAVTAGLIVVMTVAVVALIIRLHLGG